MSTPINTAFWIGVIQVLIGVLGLLAPFLQAGDFTAPAIVVFVSGVLQLVVAYLSSKAAVAAGFRRSLWHK
jgi:hypothetical protein